MKVDVLVDVCDFLRGKHFPQYYPASSLVLIPKVDNPKSFDKF